MTDLTRIAQATDPDERRAAWRRLVVSLSQDDGGPSPLEGVPADRLTAAVHAALGAGLADEVDFVDSPRAGAALYALASALPACPEQRELGRRVLSRIASGNAHAFVAIAAAMALAGGRPFQTPAVRARMALVAELPLSQGLGDGALALALVGRRQLARDWVAAPSTGSLPARRMAARLLERAACEAARRAMRGDPHAMRAMLGDTVRGATERLLADRESLVWRHVAIARGVLAPFVDGGLDALAHDLRPGLSPTEWRRAAAAAGALVGLDPERGAARVEAILGGPVFEQDRGVAAALVWGLTRALDLDPDAARGAAVAVVRAAPIESAEAVSELLLEWSGTDVAAAAGRALADALHGSEDDEARALERHAREDLSCGAHAGGEEPLRHRVVAALGAFGAQSIQEAAAHARACVDAAAGSIAALRRSDESTPEGRRAALALLRDLDVALLHGATLGQLARLEEKVEEALDARRDELADWLLARPAPTSAGRGVAVDLRALRTLVHLVDGDLGDDAVEGARTARLRRRWTRIAGAVLARFEAETPQALRRATCAALARAVDALVRVDALDPVDVVLAASSVTADVVRFEIVSEASMDPGVRHATARYAALLGATPAADALEAWAGDLVADPSTRAETLRRVLHRLTASLRAVLGAGSLRELSGAQGAATDVVALFESATKNLERMARGARGRLGLDAPAPDAEGAPPSVAVEVSRVVSGAQRAVAPAALDALRRRTALFPRPVAALCADAIARLGALPVDTAAPASRRTGAPPSEELPAWLPPRRTIGGFYVERRLGAGGVGSVFVAVRVEDRGVEDAERFALKVPEYTAAAAGMLSEAEFFDMFRHEASALIALPKHPSLARFVTFDSGSRPRPILVMELVHGASLEHVIQAQAIDTPRAFAILDDVLAGLEAMHALGIGHLDLKPSNVLLRARGGRPGQAVLVDFGLAGRRVRPGCATGAYGAPEVWVPPQGGAAPAPADVYAFACLAYETLTARTLFAAQDEVAQISAHLAHDGSPEPIRRMSQRAELAPLAELLFTSLRRDPQRRPGVGEVRASLQRMGKELSRLRWPVDAGSRR